MAPELLYLPRDSEKSSWNSIKANQRCLLRAKLLKFCFVWPGKMAILDDRASSKSLSVSWLANKWELQESMASRASSSRSDTP